MYPPIWVTKMNESIFVFDDRGKGIHSLSIVPLRPDQAERVPPGYTVVEKSPRMFWCRYQSRIWSAHFLGVSSTTGQSRNASTSAVIMSIQRQPLALMEEDCDDPDDSMHSQAKRLQVYYSTGGTVVSANVGRFHIMDRSTHSLLSPSSVANRLSLIEASRRKAANKYVEESKTSNTSSVRADDTSSTGDFDSVASTKSFGRLASFVASRSTWWEQHCRLSQD